MIELGSIIRYGYLGELMYLRLKTNRGRKYLLMMESVHDPETGKCVKRMVKSYGRYENLPEEVRRAFEDERARKQLTAELERDCLNARLTMAAESAVKAADVAKVDDDGLECDDTPRLNGAFELNYGHLALKPIWENELGLKYKISYLQQAYTEIEAWSLNDLLFYLASVKILRPQSYLQASNNRSDFIYCPWSRINQDNFYRALDFVYEFKDELLSHAVRTHMEHKKKAIRLAFFDCTNTWFETPYDDVTWRAIRFARTTREYMTNQGASHEQVNAYMETEEYQLALSEALELGKNSDIRMRGLSKEGRYAQPLVSIALAIDEDGFPIDCRIFAGNISEIHQVEPVIQSLQDKYGIKDFYFVADRGINGTEVLSKVQERNLGFVVSQKVSQQNPKDRAQMLDISGYRNYLPGDDGAFVISTEDGTVKENELRFKICDYVKTARIKGEVDPTSGKIKSRTIKVPCKIIYTFSPERKARDLAQLEEQKKKAMKAVLNHELIGAAVSGWRALVRTERTDATAGTKRNSSTGKDEKEAFRATGLKDELIRKKEEIAGYSAVIFDHPKGEHAQILSDTGVLDTYHKLVGIEESFRIMKSSFSIRPLYVRLHERIEAHCYLCVFALMMLRILQDRLLNLGYRMSTKRICEALSDARVVPSAKTRDDVFFINIRSRSRLYDPCNTGKGQIQYGLNDLVPKEDVFNGFVQNNLFMRGDTQIVMDAAGMGEVPLHVGLKQLKRLLKIGTCPDSKVLAYEHAELIKIAGI